MTEPEFDLIEYAKEKARDNAESLDGPEDDILPIMLWVGPHGIGFMPLHEGMRSDKTKEAIAPVMTATLAVSRATAVVMTTTAWMVVAPRVEVGDPFKDVEFPLSENPDRSEHVVLMCVKEGKDILTSAPVTRYPDRPPTLGEWDSKPLGIKDGDNARAGGRFGDAMHLGIDFANNMPPELIDIIEEGWRDGTQDDLIGRFLKVYAETRGMPQTPAGVTVVEYPKGDPSGSGG